MTAVTIGVGLRRSVDVACELSAYAETISRVADWSSLRVEVGLRIIADALTALDQPTSTDLAGYARGLLDTADYLSARHERTAADRLGHTAGGLYRLAEALNAAPEAS